MTGVVLSCQAEFQPMLARGGGSIVNIASMSGSIVNRGLLQVRYKALGVSWACPGRPPTEPSSTRADGC